MIIIYSFKKYLLSICYVPVTFDARQIKDRIWTLSLENPRSPGLT